MDLVGKWLTSWREYPICIIGYDIRRWESQDFEYWLGEFIKKVVVFKKYKDKGPTHIQYNSPWGFLIQWPLCFHVWYQFRPQQTDKEGNRVPGTESVFYWRIGIARWDSGDGKYYAGNRWFPLITWYLGLHWD